ncbi:MAG: ABC transporter permease [Planctomycetota bacterium]|nr:MAG: ABC transporter permease [Planctomycetota bacterium]
MFRSPQTKGSALAGESNFFATLSRPFRRSEWGLLLAILAVVVLTAVLDDRHIYWNELKALLAGGSQPWYERIPSAINIVRQTAYLGIFALGAAIVIIAGGIDLSSGSMIAFSGSMCATIMVLLAPDEMKFARPVGLSTIALAIAGTLVLALLVGSLHAWLITVVGLPPFIATLATLVGLRSLARAVVENVTAATWGGKSTQINMFDMQFRYLATSVWIPVVLFCLLATATWLLLSRTVVGRHLYALGGNEQATRLSGIHTDRLKWLAYCISALLSAVAGILYIGEQSGAYPQTLGQGYELNAIAAAVVGGCSLQGGVGTIPGTILGVLFLRTVIDAIAKIIKTGADVYEGMIVGGVVVIAVALTQLRTAGRQGKRFFGGALGVVTIVNLTLVTGIIAALMGQQTKHGATRIGSIAASIAFILLILIKLVESRRGRALGKP